MATVKGKSKWGFKIKGDWLFQSRQLMSQFSQLTKADLRFEAGKEDELLSRIGARLNKKREDVIAIIKKGLKIRSL